MTGFNERFTTAVIKTQTQMSPIPMLLHSVLSYHPAISRLILIYGIRDLLPGRSSRGQATNENMTHEAPLARNRYPDKAVVRITQYI